MSAIVERKSKGTMLNVLQGYVVTRFGSPAWQRVLDNVSADDRAIVQSAVAIGWYPTRSVLNTMAAFERVFSAEQPNLMTDFGRSGAEQDLTVFHRMFLRMANPAFVVEKIGDYWSRFHSHGKWRSQRVQNGYVSTLSDFEGNPTYCAMLTPYSGRMLELVGAKQVEVAHTECVHHGAKSCVFTGHWS